MKCVTMIPMAGISLADYEVVVMANPRERELSFTVFVDPSECPHEALKEARREWDVLILGGISLDTPSVPSQRFFEGLS